MNVELLVKPAMPGKITGATCGVIPAGSVLTSFVDFLFKGDFLERASRHTPVAAPCEWHLPDGTRTVISREQPVL
jgi:hypothetical protein